MNLTLIVPVFNESHNILSLLNIIHIYNKSKKSLLKISQVIFINDGSTDDSLDIILDYKNKIKSFDINVLNNFRNYGSHVAILNSLRYVNNNLSLIYFADQEFSLNILNKLFRNYLKNKNSIILKRDSISKKNIFSQIFWCFFIFFYNKNLNNLCSIFLIKKDIIVLRGKKIQINDIFFLNFLKYIKNFQIVLTSTKARKLGTSNWTIKKKFILFYNILFFQKKLLTIIVLFLTLILFVIKKKYLILITFIFIFLNIILLIKNLEKIKYKFIV